MNNKKATVLELATLNKNKLVVKSNRLIEASYKLSLQEQRIIILMASMVRIDDKDFQLYRIDIKDFNKIIDVKNTAIYTEIQEITKNILERVLIIKDETGRKLQIGWLSSAEYFEKEGYVELEFSPKLKPYLLELKSKFTKYQLKNVAGLKSAYSIRIYELLKQYQTVGERYFLLEEFKETLGLKPGSYKNYGDLNRRILNPVEKELGKKTDITFSKHPRKKGNKVIGVLFSIKSTNNPEKDDDELMDVAISDIDLYLKLQQFFCLSSAQAKKVLKEYEKNSERIKMNLKYIEKNIRSGNVKNPGAYTISGIENNWQDQMSLFAEEEKEARKKHKIEEKLKKFENSLDEAYKNFCGQKISEYKERLNTAEIEKIEKEIIKQKEAELGKKAIGLTTFQEIEIRNYFIKKAGTPLFTDWKKEKLLQFKKQKKIK